MINFDKIPIAGDLKFVGLPALSDPLPLLPNNIFGNGLA
jgi:hypothetical protein